MTTVIPSSTALRDLDASTTVTAPGRTGFTNTLTAVVMIIRAFYGNEDASVENLTEAVSGKICQTLSAVVMSSAAFWDLYAFFGGRAETESSVTILVTLCLIVAKFVTFHTVTALMSSIGLV